jgi:glycosyltransferase involved in cell wall biosynthesis
MLEKSTRKTRVLFVHHFSGMGGATMSLYYIVERLNPALFDIEVLFLGGEGDGVEYFRSRNKKVLLMSGIAVYPHAYGAYMSLISKRPWLPFLRLLKLDSEANRLLPFFARQKYDIVHLNTSLLLSVGKAAKLAGSKVVWHVRESLHKGNLGFRRYFVRKWIQRYADVILTITAFEKLNLGNPDKAVVVHNYIDFKKFDQSISGEAIRRELGFAATDFVVCNLGGAVHSKGADVFVKAAHILVKKHRNIKFVLSGIINTQGPTASGWRNRIKKFIGLKRDLSTDTLHLIHQYNLEKHVIITGVRTDIPDLLAASDVLAWTATVQHFARPIIEAAAMSKPSVAADFPNTHVALTEGVTGLVFKPGNVVDLASKIEALYNDRMKCRAMGIEARKLTIKKFNADTNFKIIGDIYNQLMA